MTKPKRSQGGADQTSSPPEPQPFLGAGTLIHPKLAYSIPEAAEASSLSESGLWAFIASGALGAKKMGRRTYIMCTELVRFLESGEDVGR